MLLLSCFSRVRLFATPWTTARRPPCPSPIPGVYTNSCPLSQWCHTTVSSSVVPIFHLQSFPDQCLFFFFFLLYNTVLVVFSNESALRVRWPKYWSFSFSISPSNEYSVLISFRIDWFDLLAVQGLLRVFSSTTFGKHQFFGAQHSLWSNSHIHTRLLEKSQLWHTDLCW